MTFDDAVAIAFGLLLLVAPVLAGRLCGRPAAKRLPARWRLRAAIASPIVLVALVPFVTVLLPSIGTWDVALALLLFGLGLSLAFQPPARPRLLAVVIVVPLLLLELVCRVALAPTARLPPPREARLTIEGTQRDLPCYMVYPLPHEPGPTSGSPHRAKRVLHLGDSMVAGLGIRPEESVTAQLERLTPNVSQLKLAAVGAGPDTYLLALRRWLPVVKPDAVVVSLFLGNDLADTGRNYLCCRCGPLLDVTSPGVPARCPEPEWSYPFGILLATSSAPYPLRVLGSTSALASRLHRGLLAVSEEVSRRALFGSRLDVRPGAAEWNPELDVVLPAIVAEAKKAGIPLLFAVLPYRPTLQDELGIPVLGPSHGPGAKALHEHFVAAAHATGAPVVDLYQPIVEEIRAHGVDATFANAYREDFHFSAAGSAVFARELEGALERIGIGP